MLTFVVWLAQLSVVVVVVQAIAHESVECKLPRGLVGIIVHCLFLGIESRFKADVNTTSVASIEDDPETPVNIYINMYKRDLVRSALYVGHNTRV